MKTTVNKTIPFRQRDTSNLHNKKPSDKLNSCAKVIPYPRYKKKKEKSIKFVKNNKIFFIILSIVLFFALIFFIDTTLLKGRLGPTGKPITNSNNVDTTVSNAEFNTYSGMIEKDIENTLSITTSYDVSTKSIHKNGSKVYLQGNLSVTGEKTRPFDAVINNDTTTSLVVNGEEYIKK